MKSSLIILLLVMAALILTPVVAYTQTEQTASTSPPLSQPLIREGTLATRLADALNLGPATSETEAESALSAVGIAPRNGWVADYPVTPDIAAELQTSVSDAATSGRIPVTKDDSLKAFQDVMIGLNLPVTPGIPDTSANSASAPAYPDAEVAGNYYYDEGPPVVTYYAPPPDYAYLYSWVPYPFWWWDFWFPGFYVLVDFDGHHGHDHHGHDGHDGHGHDGHSGKEFVSNHFRDPKTGTMSRIDPVNRVHGGTLAGGRGGWNSSSAQSSAQSIVSNRRTFGPRVNSPAVSSSVNGMSSATPRGQTSVSSSGRTSVAPAVGTRRIATYNTRSFSQSAYRGSRIASAAGQSRSFSQPVYRASGNFSSSMGSRSFSQPAYRASGNFSPSISGRSFSAPSAGRSFSGSSLGGMRSFGGSSFGGRASFGGGGFRR